MSLKDTFQNVVSEFRARYDTLRGKKDFMEETYQKIKKSTPDNKIGEFRRTAGIGGINLAWFLFLLGKYGLKDLHTIIWDNRVIDDFKDTNANINIKKTDSGFQKFYKKLQKSHPAAAARLQLWMVYALLTGLVAMGTKTNHNNNDKEEKTDTKTEVIIQPEEETDSYDAGIPDFGVNMTYAEFKGYLDPVIPMMLTVLIAEEGVKLNDQGLHVPYFDTKGNRWTIGFGSTVLKNGKRVTQDTPPMTTKEAWDLALWHIKKTGVLPMMYWYYIYDNKLLPKTLGEIVGMGSVIFNSSNKLLEAETNKNNRERTTNLRRAQKEYGDDIPDSLILHYFNKYPIVETRSFGKHWFNHSDKHVLANALGGFCAEGGGIYWRRWLEAGIISGEISPADLLDCPYNGVADFFRYMGGNVSNDNARRNVLWQKNGDNWEVRKSTYKDFKEWLKNPQTRDAKGRTGRILRKTIKDFLPPEIIQDVFSDEYISDIRYANECADKAVVFNKGIKKLKDKQNFNGFNSKNNDYSV